MARPDVARPDAERVAARVGTLLPPRPVRPGATAVLVFTSGSTTRPRAVALSHENLRANLRSLLAVRQARPGEAVLSTLPPSHAYELVGGILAPLAAGARVVFGGPPAEPTRRRRARSRYTRGARAVALEALAREVMDGLARWRDRPVVCVLVAAGTGRERQEPDRRASRRTCAMPCAHVSGPRCARLWSAPRSAGSGAASFGVGIDLDVG
jgi:acyl-CoA synthetase (AMP-forming)/AMP-acid ligase II